MHKCYLLGIATLLIVAGLAGEVCAQGESGVPSLGIPPGARANGMGEAYVALAEDATGGWWNAGGLAFVTGRNFAFMHSQLVPDLASDVYYEFLGYSSEVGGIGVFSASLIYLTYGESIATDDQGTERGKFDSWEGSAVASFAMPLTDNFGLGVSMKFIHVDYAPALFTIEQQEGSGSTVAVDAGAMFKDEELGLSAGIALTNMGPDISFVDREQSDPLPFTLRTGLAYTALSDEVSNLLFSFDIEQSVVWLTDQDIRRPRAEIYHVGGEYRYVNLLAVRLGYIHDDDGDFSDPTYGLGFIYKDRLSLDYANVPQASALERVHRWSLYWTF